MNSDSVFEARQNISCFYEIFQILTEKLNEKLIDRNSIMNSSRILILVKFR